MSQLRFKVVEEAFGRKAVDVKLPKELPNEYYGKAVFTRAKMYQYIPKTKYDALVDPFDHKYPIAT